MVNATNTTEASGSLLVSHIFVHIASMQDGLHIQFMLDPVTGITVGIQNSGIASKDQPVRFQVSKKKVFCSFEARH